MSITRHRVLEILAIAREDAIRIQEELVQERRRRVLGILARARNKAITSYF